ncbi:hypothetical protein ZWY2020_033130 [Hordeum vulgare]|nr:hypothetical protein ZWY2020_033130 [Hordeum vulgare]
MERTLTWRRALSDTSRMLLLGMRLGLISLRLASAFGSCGRSSLFRTLPYVSRCYDARVLVQYTEAMDRAFRALTVELYATRARIYDALTELQPSHCPRVSPMRIREPSRTELPSALEWTDVGGWLDQVGQRAHINDAPPPPPEYMAGMIQQFEVNRQFMQGLMDQFQRPNMNQPQGVTLQDFCRLNPAIYRSSTQPLDADDSLRDISYELESANVPLASYVNFA